MKEFDFHCILPGRFAEVDLQNDKQNFPFTIIEGPDGGVLVELMYEKVIFFDIARETLVLAVTLDVGGGGLRGTAIHAGAAPRHAPRQPQVTRTLFHERKQCH